MDLWSAALGRKYVIMRRSEQVNSRGKANSPLGECFFLEYPLDFYSYDQTGSVLLGVQGG
jgi:hypothetical protein